MDLFTFDDDYVRRLREHDAATEEHFYTYFRPRLFNYLRSRARSYNDLDEIVQESFGRIFASIYAEKLRDGRTLAGFVFAVCHNVLLERWRTPESENIDDHPEPAVDGPNQEDAMITEERKRTVHRILNDMKPPGGDILRAKMQGASNDDICKHFGVSRDYLRVLMYRARKQFRGKFPPDDETNGD